MLSLINQNKQHARKHTAILQIMTTLKKLHFYYKFKGYMISYKPFWIHQYLYFHKI